MEKIDELLVELQKIFSYRTKVDMVLIPLSMAKAFVDIHSLPVDYSIWKGSNNIETPYGHIGLVLTTALVHKPEVYLLERN